MQWRQWKILDVIRARRRLLGAGCRLWAPAHAGCDVMCACAVITAAKQSRALIRSSARMPRTSRHLDHDKCNYARTFKYQIIFVVNWLYCDKMPKNILAEMGSQVGLTPRNAQNQKVGSLIINNIDRTNANVRYAGAYWRLRTYILLIDILRYLRRNEWLAEAHGRTKIKPIRTSVVQCQYRISSVDSSDI